MFKVFIFSTLVGIYTAYCRGVRGVTTILAAILRTLSSFKMQLKFNMSPTAQQNQQNDIWVQRRLRSTCSSAQSVRVFAVFSVASGGPQIFYANSEDSDQTGWMPRPIRVFAGRTSQVVGFVMLRFINLWYFRWKLKSQFKQFEFVIWQTANHHFFPGSLTQSRALLTSDQGSRYPAPAQPHKFHEYWPWNNFYGHIPLPLFQKRGVVS